MKTAVRFVVGEHQFVIDVGLVHEVLPACTTPMKDAWLAWRERQLPVVYLGQVLDLDSLSQQPLVVSASPGSDDRIVLVADKVEGLVDLASGCPLTMAPALVAAGELVRAVWRDPGSPRLLLELRLPVNVQEPVADVVV